MLGENIRSARQKKGLTQEALAEQLHMVRQTVSKWEKGLSVPDATTLAALSEILEVPVAVLLDQKTPAAPERKRNRLGSFLWSILAAVVLILILSAAR